ncbi:MAG: hypothetical protein VB111_07240 [Clostridiaceae bacterium]|nr:hypothetical protein [Clostridiaceae bacterium]
MKALQPNQINYIARAKETPELSRRKARGVLLVLPFIALLFLFSAVVGVCYYDIYNVQKPLADAYRSRIGEENLREQSDVTAYLQEISSWLNANVAALADADAALAADPDLSQAAYDVIAAALELYPGVSMNTFVFDRATHALEIELTSDNVQVIPFFVEALASRDAILSEVHYGYSAVSSPVDALPMYEFTVSCQLAESGGNVQ